MFHDQIEIQNDVRTFMVTKTQKAATQTIFKIQNNFVCGKISLCEGKNYTTTHIYTHINKNIYCLTKRFLHKNIKNI